MLKEVDIKNFRSINEARLKLRPITVLTGLNSTGKSACFSAILSALYHDKNAENSKILLSNLDFSFATNRNRNTAAEEYSVVLKSDNGEMVLSDSNIITTPSTESNGFYDLEKNVYYLSANRLGYRMNGELYNPKYKIGIQGEYIFGTFFHEQSKPLNEDICFNTKTSLTLSYQVGQWLSYILSIPFDVKTEEITSTQIKVSYTADGTDNILPQQLGVGVSYLVKILIMCLRANEGDVLMIENPEIHLHPAAQSRLGEFFSRIIKGGIQLLIETHSENLIEKLQYQIYSNEISSEDIIIYYKQGVEDSFLKINIESNGKLSPDFPEGFFDASLNDLLEIG